MNNLAKYFFSALLALAAQNIFAARVNLESYAHNVDSIPIAVLPFKASGTLGLSENDPSATVASDIEFCGR
ncbi:MAG: hypothetical protein PHC61_18080, partial [Chitinivibrionales bacterium]|nr:hypothetical protein [Chitinivibrionales bacterium]